jgi:hypothetical protein
MMVSIVCLMQYVGLGIMVFNATFNNILAISWIYQYPVYKLNVDDIN